MQVKSGHPSLKIHSSALCRRGRDEAWAAEEMRVLEAANPGQDFAVISGVLGRATAFDQLTSAGSH